MRPGSIDHLQSPSVPRLAALGRELLLDILPQSPVDQQLKRIRESAELNQLGVFFCPERSVRLRIALPDPARNRPHLQIQAGRRW